MGLVSVNESLMNTDLTDLLCLVNNILISLWNNFFFQYADQPCALKNTNLRTWKERDKKIKEEIINDC